MTEINTKEALIALPAGTVLRERNGDIGEWDGTVLAGTDGGWWGLDYVPAVFPLTVLYRPDQPDLSARIDAVLELHQEHICGDGPCVDKGKCRECGFEHPCETRRLLTGKEEVK